MQGIQNMQEVQIREAQNKNTNTTSREWHGKPYYSLDSYCKNTYGEKVYKIALDAGMTCPNRDGKLDTRGCIFCSSGGSGDFAAQSAVQITASSTHSQRIEDSIQAQLLQGKELFNGRITSGKKLSAKKTGHSFIAYFQSYTNTYASVSYLYEVFHAALSDTSIIGISIGTRPDCISTDTCALFLKLRQEFPHKFIWIELGLQTIHEQTAVYIRRGYPLSCFEACIQLLRAYDIPVIVHVILGLPGETHEMMLETIHYLNHCNIQGIKLQLLHVLQNTDLCIEYQKHVFTTLTRNAYIDLVISCLEHLSPDIVIHRVTGDGPKNLLVAPLWSSDKRRVLNTLHQEMKQRNTQQGKAWLPS